MSSTSSLLSEIVDIGNFIGLLQVDESGAFTINQTWFSNPIDALKLCGTRMPDLLKLLSGILEPSVTDAPAVFTNAEWYAIPNPKTKTNTVFHLVMSSAGDSEGQLGIGVLHQFTGDLLDAQFYTYLPLLKYDNAGTTFIKGGEPLQMSLSITSKDKFTVANNAAENTTFTAVGINSDIFFSDTLPSISVKFANLTGPYKTNTYTTLAGLVQPEVLSWLAEVLLQGNTWLNLKVGNTDFTIGDVLATTGFITKNDKQTYDLTYQSLKNEDAKTIALNFVFDVLNLLCGKPLIEMPGGNIGVVKRTAADDSTDYGLNITAQLDVTKPSDETNTSAPPAIALCLGKWLTDEEDDTSWMKRSLGSNAVLPEQQGIAIFVLRKTNNAYSFQPSFSLTSVGLNIAGSNNKPLVDLKGYTVGGIEARASFDFTDLNYGFACRLDELGIPLGPGFEDAVGGSATNPVAKNLVSSGSADKTGDQDAVNPAFSVSFAYMEGAEFEVQLYDNAGKATDTVLLPINRSLGPLQCEKIGIGWQESTKTLSFIFDGGVKLSALEIALDELSIGIPITTPADFSAYDLDLNGMSLSLKAGEVELSAAFVKLPPDLTATPARNFTEYDGYALLKAGMFNISALGSYAYVTDVDGKNGFTSMFIFGMLLGDIGGPPFFYVTGIAAGFGYNRQINLPDMNSVTDFPFLKVFNDPAAIGAKPDGSATDPLTVLANIDSYVPPQRGEYWLAAGVRFTSFDLINSTALLSVEFGKELEIGLLGITWMCLPPSPKPGTPSPIKYLYAELGIEVKLLPEKGFLGATAILTPNSFLIDPACKLTGGFAFYVWFGSNPHAGEFVMTIGGYHPNFKAPDHYPTVPRVGFNWPVSDVVSISGDAYFALTPSAAMAGAGLHILYSSGNLKAWFNAQMDAIIVWAPFHYNIDISVSLGASYKIDWGFTTSTIKIELGADLTIWGPKMGGKAHINWAVISFTINFGAGENTSFQSAIAWNDDSGTGFAQTLLPHKNTADKQPVAQGMNPRTFLRAEAETISAAADTASGIYTITVNDGLLNTISDNNNPPIWIVRPNNFAFSIATVIPAIQIDITEPTNVAIVKPSDAGNGAVDYSTVYIRPMQASLSTSTLTISLIKNDGGDVVYGFNENFDFDINIGKLPAAKWGAPTNVPEMNKLLEGQLLGLQNIKPKEVEPQPNGIGKQLLVDISTAFGDRKINTSGTSYLPFPNNLLPVWPTPVQDVNALETIKSSLMDQGVVDKRTAIFLSLQSTFGIDVGTNGTLDNFAQKPALILTGCPLAFG